MYAHALRKWSVFKLLMYLFLPLMIFLVCCQSATAMSLQTARQQNYYFPIHHALPPPHIRNSRWNSHVTNPRDQDNLYDRIYSSSRTITRKYQEDDKNVDDDTTRTIPHPYLSHSNQYEASLGDNTNDNIRSDNLYEHINSNKDNDPQEIESPSQHQQQQQQQLFQPKHPNNRRPQMHKKRERHESYRKKRRMTLRRLQEVPHHNTSTSLVSLQTDQDNLNVISNRSRRDSHNNSHKSQKRTRRKNKFCSINDPSALAYVAPTVFIGEVRSRNIRQPPYLSASFNVIRVFKDLSNHKLASIVRLNFNQSNLTRKPCDIYGEQFSAIGYTHKQIQQGEKYYLFVKQETAGNFTIIGEPIKLSGRRSALKHLERKIEEGTSVNYGQRASIKDLRYEVKKTNSSMRQTIMEKSKIRLVCYIDGRPTPKVTWFFKNSTSNEFKSLNKTRAKYTFLVHTYRRRSVLVIENATADDDGVYTCRAKNRVNNISAIANKKITIKVESPPVRSDSSKGETRNCTNTTLCIHGKCLEVVILKEMFCECDDGYEGDRCNQKIPSSYKSKFEVPDYYGSNRP